MCLNTQFKSFVILHKKICAFCTKKIFQKPIDKSISMWYYIIGTWKSSKKYIAAASAWRRGGNPMRLKDVNWQGVRFSDRTILKKDLKLMSQQQREALENIEVIPTDRKGFYKVKEAWRTKRAGEIPPKLIRLF